MECLNCFYCVFCALWPVPCALCPVTCDLWPVPCALWPVTCALWPDLWPVTCVLYLPFHGHDSTCHDSTLITLRMASQYVNGCKNNGRREFCRGNRNGERNTGWQGKLITKRHNCNEARIPTNAFCLKRKALLRGKRRHDERLLVINVEFDCRVRMYFCRRFHNGRNIINTAKSEMVRCFTV